MPRRGWHGRRGQHLAERLIGGTARGASTRTRCRLAIGFTVIGAVALNIAAARACVPQATIMILPRASGEPGASLTVEGVNFEQAGEVRWNTLDGPLLAAVPAPSFKTTILIPPVEPGLYTLVALERGSGGGVGNVARAPVQVVSTKLMSAPEAVAPSSGGSSISATDIAVGGVAIGALVALGAAFGAGWASRRALKR